MRVLRCLIYLSLILVVTQVSAQVVEIPDPNLEQAIREEIKLPSEAPITQKEMLQLTGLEAGNYGIIELTGIEYATNLGFLDIGGNQIWNIQPLGKPN